MSRDAVGYTAAHPGLAGSSLSAVSLSGLRKQVAALMLPDKVEVVLSLDRNAKRVATVDGESGPGNRAGRT